MGPGLEIGFLHEVNLDHPQLGGKLYTNSPCKTETRQCRVGMYPSKTKRPLEKGLNQVPGLS